MTVLQRLLWLNQDGVASARQHDRVTRRRAVAITSNLPSHGYRNSVLKLRGGAARVSLLASVRSSVAPQVPRGGPGMARAPRAAQPRPTAPTEAPMTTKSPAGSPRGRASRHQTQGASCASRNDGRASDAAASAGAQGTSCRRNAAGLPKLDRAAEPGLGAGVLRRARARRPQARRDLDAQGRRSLVVAGGPPGRVKAARRDCLPGPGQHRPPQREVHVARHLTTSSVAARSSPPIVARARCAHTRHGNWVDLARWLNCSASGEGSSGETRASNPARLQTYRSSTSHHWALASVRTAQPARSSDRCSARSGLQSRASPCARPVTTRKRSAARADRHRTSRSRGSRHAR